MEQRAAHSPAFFMVVDELATLLGDSDPVDHPDLYVLRHCRVGTSHWS